MSTEQEKFNSIHAALCGIGTINVATGIAAWLTEDENTILATLGLANLFVVLAFATNLRADKDHQNVLAIFFGVLSVAVLGFATAIDTSSTEIETEAAAGQTFCTGAYLLCEFRNFISCARDDASASQLIQPAASAQNGSDNKKPKSQQ